MASRVFSPEKESGGSERNSNPQPQATLLIPLPLPLTVALHDLRVLGGDAVSGSRDVHLATASGFPARPGDTRDQSQVFLR